MNKEGSHPRPPAVKGRPGGGEVGAGTGGPRHSVWRRGAGAVFRYREASIVIAGLLLVVYFQSASAAFLSPPNLENLVQFTGTTAIIAVGEVMVLVCGELDLSVGMVYALSPFVMYFAAAGIVLVTLLGAWGALWIVNRWR